MPRTRVSFATCNLYNLNLPDFSIYDSYKWTDEQYTRKIKWLANVVSSLAADVWGFQELWHQEGLNAVFKAANNYNSYDLLVPEGHYGDKIVCAGAVRKDILTSDKPEWIESFPEQFILESKGEDKQTPEIRILINAFSRPVLHFRVQPRRKSRPISVFVAHLKSKRPTKIFRESWYNSNEGYYHKHNEGIGAALSTIRRTAEAAALRMMITDRLKDNNDPVVVLGDLNDSGQSNTLNIVGGDTNYLRAPWSIGGSATNLYSVSVLQALRSLRDVYYTYKIKNMRDTIDHILVSQELYDQSKNREWGFRDMVVINDHLNNENHKVVGTTDHGIVKAEFEYRPASTS